METLRFGIIGGGLMGREIAATAARWCNLSGFAPRPEIVAIASATAKSCAWFTANVPTIKQSTTDYHELLGNPAVDAVYCAVPHDLHLSIYRDILAAGKHLLAEKPFGIDLAANETLLAEIARRPDLVVRCSSHYAYFPAVQRILRLLRENRFGRILEVDCGFLHSSDLNPDKPLNWKRMVARNGAYGCLGDLGLHVFHGPLRAGWRPRNVRAILSKIVSERPTADGGRAPCDTWDNAHLLCEMAAGDQTFPMMTKIERIAPGETNTWYLRILGTQFGAAFSLKRPRTLEWMEITDPTQQRWQTEDLGHQSVYPTITGGIFEFGFGDAMLQMFAAYCQRVAQGNQGDVPFDCATPAETHVTHQLFTAALESQRTGGTIALDSDD
ncbi:Gfo/Idh/MocA family oxidoreductase [bacterium]|nr:Gfo/Idh/MocA family oxidoreductase [bacterium]